MQVLEQYVSYAIIINMKQPDEFTLSANWALLFEDAGLSAQKVLTQANLSQDLFTRDKPVFLPAADYFNFWQAANELAVDHELPLLLANSLSVEFFDPPVYAALCSNCLIDAVQLITKYKLITCPIEVTAQEHDEEFVIEFDLMTSIGTMPDTYCLFELAFFTQFARMALRSAIKPTRVQLLHVPEHRALYEAYFGVAVEQSHRVAISFSREDASKPFRTTSSMIMETIENGLAEEFSDANGSFQHRVKTLLVTLLPRGEVGLATVADKMTVSPRTLQRRLKQEGCSFNEVLLQTRKEIARQYLRKLDMAQAEIAFLLGFQDANSFIRAYRCWTGESLGQYRQNLKQLT
ncbi:helix-turn-helix transcriptional regulator [Spongorhabdus nitratireducens]